MMVYAYVNHGRWIVDCPDCNTAWLVTPSHRSTLIDFFGGKHEVCFCGANILIQFPLSKRAIDAILSIRPMRSRNWVPGETLAALRAENVAHTALLTED